ncbi:unnamed protein product [marine sediment metagenome]|uniref:Lysine biosynthesis protein LysW n=1 Tax=marine sediment metagenome TaxID=412755 RepID=X1E3X3_9ZZZZ
METVNLIASGYEWECPECDAVVLEDEIPKDRIVNCITCGGKFEIGIIDHAHE